MKRIEVDRTSHKAFLNNKEERKEKKIYKEIEPTDYLFNLAIDLHPEGSLGNYLNQFSNFCWEKVISCNYYLKSNEAKTNLSCKILDIRNINTDDLVSIFGDLDHFEHKIQKEIINLKDLINFNLDNYNRFTVRECVCGGCLLTLIKILETIFEKLEEIKSNKKSKN